MNSFSTPRGFVALVSAVILSLLLMTLVFSESAATFWTRYDQTDQESQGASIELSDSCMYEALLDYTEDPDSLSESKSVDLGAIGSCTIEAAKSGNSILTFTTHSLVRGVPTEITVTAQQNDDELSVISWRPTTSIPP